MPKEEHTTRLRGCEGLAFLVDRTLPLPRLSFFSLSSAASSYREIARCQNFLICRSGTTEQSAGTIYPREEKTKGRRRGGKRDFIGSRGIAFQPRKREYRDSDEPPPDPRVPPPYVLGRVEGDATNLRLTSFPFLFSLSLS